MRSVWLLSLLVLGCAGIVAPIDLHDGGLAFDAGAGGGSAGGGGGGGTTPADAGVDAGDPAVDAGPACLQVDAGVEAPTGAMRTLSPGATLKSVLSQSAPGDRVVVHGGSYPAETLTNLFAADVWVVAAAGETPVFHGLNLNKAAHLVFSGVHFDGTVNLNGAHDVVFDHVDLDVGTQDISGLELFNSAGATHDVRVLRSRVAGGARTIFMGGQFGLEETWNHHLEFRGNEFVCGTHNCFQLSGARDTVIEDNDFHDPKGAGVLTAGATRITIARNRMRGTKSVAVPAIQLATPGKEWDNYGGVEHMISSDILVANNLIVSWGGAGIELDAVTNVKMVFNTVVDGVGLSTWRRSPHDQQNNVILTGNEQLQLWNNILPSIQLDPGDPRPMFEANNYVGTGGGGVGLVRGTASYVDLVEYQPVASSPARHGGVVTALTPAFDRRGHPRGAPPDLGAFESDSLVCR
jgi:Right handed beta helix region